MKIFKRFWYSAFNPIEIQFKIHKCEYYTPIESKRIYLKIMKKISINAHKVFSINTILQLLSLVITSLKTPAFHLSSVYNSMDGPGQYYT